MACIQDNFFNDKKGSPLKNEVDKKMMEIEGG